MRADPSLDLLFRHIDGETSPEEAARVEELLTRSAEARSVVERLLLFRAELQETAEPAPDVADTVIEEIGRPADRRTSLKIQLAAALVAGVLAGMVFVGLRAELPAPLAVADVPTEVVAAQSQVDSLLAEVTVTERGLHPDVPQRTYRGRFAYRSPESLVLDLEDFTEYPSEEWVPNDVVRVIDEDTQWSAAVARCPSEALPTCTPSEPRVAATAEREPFPAASIPTLDVVVPVGGFVRADTPALVGFESRAGREAIGVRVTAAQLAGLIEFFVGEGNWRRIHPTDRVELWLDTATLVPLGLTVYPADSADRSLWAVRHNYTDRPDTPILAVEWEQLRVNEGDLGSFPPPPVGAVVREAGFSDGPLADLDRVVPDVPSGMSLHRTGTIQVGPGPLVSVATWTDGRAWLKMEWTAGWEGERLFGDLGAPVRPVRSGRGVLYVDGKGERVAIHGAELDVVVSGSLPLRRLRSVAESVPVAGLPVPGHWAESTSGTLAEAREAIGHLLLPENASGFGPPAVRVDRDSVSLSFAGPGNRAFVLTQTRGKALSPPLDADVRGVTVRQRSGRYSAEQGLLEWVEEGTAIGLRSTSLSLEELMEIAASLETQ